MFAVSAAGPIRKWSNAIRIIGSRSDRRGDSFVWPAPKIAATLLFIGTLLRPPIKQIRLDWLTIRLMPRVDRASSAAATTGCLPALAGLAEDAGFRIVGVDEVAPEIFVPEVSLAAISLRRSDRADIARALEMIAALGPFDVGQAAVVANNHVLPSRRRKAPTICSRALPICARQGRVTTPHGVGVLVKAPKPGQDRRFDLPSIGPRTVENVARAGLAGFAVTAGSTIDRRTGAS